MGYITIDHSPDCVLRPLIITKSQTQHTPLHYSSRRVDIDEHQKKAPASLSYLHHRARIFTTIDIIDIHGPKSPTRYRKHELLPEMDHRQESRATARTTTATTATTATSSRLQPRPDRQRRHQRRHAGLYVRPADGHGHCGYLERRTPGCCGDDRAPVGRCDS